MLRHAQSKHERTMSAVDPQEPVSEPPCLTKGQVRG